MGADAAQKAANKARPDEDALNNLDRPAPDHTWHDTPDISKDNLKNQAQKVYGGNPKEDIKHAANQANQEAHPNGSSDPKDIARTAAHDQATGDSSGVNARGGLQAGANTLKQRVAANTDDDTKETARRKKEEYRERTKQYFQQKVPEERRDQIIFRLKKMVVECQQHPDYQQAITTLLDLAEEYGGHAKNLGQQGTGTAQEARSGFAQAEEDLKTLLERFANGTSSDDLWDAVNVIYRDADRDPELKDWFRSMDRYIRRCLTEEGYILEDESTNEWNRLYDHGNFLLRDKYRGHTDQVVDELKFLGDQFDQDPHNTAFANSLTKLFNDLGQDQNGKPTFKPHLLRDLRDVIIPAIFENAAYIPIPRIEYSDPQFDAVIENLVLESDNFMPNVLEIANENYLRWGRKNIASKNRHGVEVHVAGIQMDLRDVSYYVKRKQGFPSLSDTGLMNILLAGEGFSFKMRMSTPDARDRQNFFKVDKVDVDVHNLNIKLKKSKHKLLFNLFKPIMLKVIRPALQKAVEKAIKDKVHDLDSKLYQVKLEADRAKEEALDNPDQAPNIYNRYATAAQNKFLKGKKKAQEAAADKKVNMAVTKEDSIFPNIHLPGGISSKATEYKELARKGDRWESPVFSIGAASRSSDIPPAPKITRKPHRSANPKDVTHPGNTFDANHNPQQYKSHNDNTYNQTNSSQGTGYGTTQTGYQQSSSGAGYSQGGNQSGAGFNQANPAYGDRYAQDPVLNQAYAERTNNQAPYS
jgi:DNA ligase-4